MRIARARPPAAPTATIDLFVVVTMLACLYAVVVFPLLLASCDQHDTACQLAPRIESKLFWPAISLFTVAISVRHLSRLSIPPHLIWLFAYLMLAGASVAWAFKPESAAVRYLQQMMIVCSTVLPALLAGRRADLIRGLFICFGIASVLNFIFIFIKPPIDIKNATWGYPGYFAGKNYLGEFATVVVLLSINEILTGGRRRIQGIVVALFAFPLLVLSNSKTSMAVTLITPTLAATALFIRRKTNLSLAVILLAIPVGFFVFSTITGVTINRLSFAIYGDSTFTGRTIIWDFVAKEIAERPLLGWGYQSFWLVGADAPSMLDAPGWVKSMPNAHNGYLDLKIELGYAGYVIFLGFIISTVHAIGRIADVNRQRAWIVLSLALHVIITNCLESIWLRGFEMLWVVFLILAAETARYWKVRPKARVPLALRRASRAIVRRRRLRPRTVGRPLPSPA